MKEAKTKMLTRHLSLWVVAAALLGSAGCNTYTYFEVTTSLDPFTITTENAFMISTCRVDVSGAATDTFYITRRCPPPSGIFDIGVFEYSTFADTGTMNFKLSVFRGLGETDKIGEGSVSLPFESGKTVMGALKAMGTPR